MKTIIKFVYFLLSTIATIAMGFLIVFMLQLIAAGIGFHRILESALPELIILMSLIVIVTINWRFRLIFFRPREFDSQFDSETQKVSILLVFILGVAVVLGSMCRTCTEFLANWFVWPNW